LKDKRFYVGYSEDLRRRILEHQQRKVVSTKNRLPLKLICYEAYVFREEAQKREKYLKSSDARKEIKIRLFKSIV
jgi:putative endonuclease